MLLKSPNIVRSNLTDCKDAGDDNGGSPGDETSWSII